MNQSFEQALRYYRKAADQGSDYAMNRIGMFYDNASGVPEDDAEAVYSEHYACELHPEISLPEIAPRNFSFNSPHGACPGCHHQRGR